MLLVLGSTGLSLTSVARAESVFGMLSDQTVTAFTPELVKRDPIAVLGMEIPPWDHREKVIDLMRHSVQLDAYMRLSGRSVRRLIRVLQR